MIDITVALTALGAVLAPLLSGLVDPGSAQAYLGPVLETLTVGNAPLYGGSGIISIGTVRWLVKRRTASGAGGTTDSTSVATTTTGTSGSSAVTPTTPSGGEKHNVAFTLPGFLPVSDGIRQVTHNEVHAVELGLVVGVVSVWLLSVGRTNAVYNIVIAFVAGSLGYNHYSSKAFETIRYEPWYALLALAGGGTLGWLIFIMEPGLLTPLGV